MRDGLRALLKTVPHLNLVEQAGDSLSALEMASRRHPALILLGSNLPDEDIQMVLHQTRATQPGTRCLVLVNNVHQQSLAQAKGADSVLLTGFPTEKFLMTIEALLAV
jgi:DNA-binding NarL/FixJ family response regulator